MAKYKNNFVPQSENNRFGVLLANLGTPKSPQTSDVRKYLRQFLSDSRVVELPKPLWWFILNGVILVLRPKRSAHAYKAIWTQEGSPLLVNSLRQRDALESCLKNENAGNAHVICAMRYGEPSIGQAIVEFEELGIDRIVVMPMYPQYSGPTAGSVFDEIGNVLRLRRIVPSIRFVNGYAQEPPYIFALKQSVLEHWDRNGRGQKLVMSFHGLPEESCSRDGDPYQSQCFSTARLLAEELELLENQWLVCFQSRFGPKKWLQPYADSVLRNLPKEGIRHVDVICPGFSADCLETLEEVNMGYRELFLESGGKKFHYIPCLNDHPQHINMIAEFIRNTASNWISN